MLAKFCQNFNHALAAEWGESFGNLDLKEPAG